MLSYTDLTTTMTRDEVLAALLVDLGELGFTVTSWQSGDPVYTLLKAFSELYSRSTEHIATVAQARHVATAVGEFLTRASESDFDNTRQKAIAAERTISFTTAAGESSETVAIGEMVVAYADDMSLTYRNTAAFTLTAGATVTTTCRCDIAGKIGNTPGIGEITEMISTYPGVTCVDIAKVTVGLDEESDADLLARNLAKWPSLSVENTNAAIEGIIKTGVAGIKDVKVDDSNPRGAGTVDIYCAGALARCTSSEALAARDLIRPRFFNSTDRIRVLQSLEETLSIEAEVLCETAVGATTTKANVEAAIAALLTALPIGGRTYSGGSSNVLTLDDIYQAIRSATGVVQVTLTTPTDDVSIGQFAKLKPTNGWPGITYATTTVA